MLYTRTMRLVAQVKLLPRPDQAAVLRQTLKVANAACDYISGEAWDRRVFGQFALHRLTYHQVRERFALSAQVTVRCIAKVCDAYKLDRRARRTFRPTGSIAYDSRILRWKVAASEVSIWTVAGRQTIPFVCGERQRALLATQQGESDLALVKGKWYLFATCNVEEPEPRDVSGVLGCDLGIVNILTDSDGTVYSGKAVEESRRTFAHHRRNLQRKSTHPARRKLKKIRGKQARYQKDMNHRISKAVVQNAEDTHRAIAIEELGGIRDRVTVRRRQRAQLANWSFAQLRGYLSYKAKRAGIALVAVDPRNTSRQCPVCGHIEKANRSSQSVFLCRSCGHAGLADHIAAQNIAFRARAAVNLPMVPTYALAYASGTSSRL